MQQQARQNDFKSEYLYRTCSVATNLVTSPNNPFQNTVLLCCVILENYETFPHSLISTISAALLQALPQANTAPFRNALVKMRNQVVNMMNGQGTLLVSVQINSTGSSVSLHVHLNMKS